MAKSPTKSSTKSGEPKAKAKKAPKAPSKSKLIKDAHKALGKALKEHAELTAGSGVSLKKAQRAGAKVAAAAAEYAEAVQAKTGLESPFVPGNGKLDGATIQSLEAERVEIEKVVTGTIPVVLVEEPAAEAAAAEPAAATAPKTPARRATTPRATTPRATTTRAPRTATAAGTRRTDSSIGAGTTAAAPRTRRATAPKPAPEAESASE